MITKINNKNAPFTYFTSTEIIKQNISRFDSFKIVPLDFRRFRVRPKPVVEVSLDKIVSIGNP